MAAQDDITLTDQDEQRQLNQIASHLTQATQNYVAPTQVTPPVNQHPIPQLVQVPMEEEEKKEVKETELQDIVKGLQGKPRTAPSSDFLQAKMRWVSKKGGGVGVKLK